MGKLTTRLKKNLKLFVRTFLVFAIIGCTIDFLFNGFQFVAADIAADLIEDVLLAAITVYICGEAKQKMNGKDALSI